MHTLFDYADEGGNNVILKKLVYMPEEGGDACKRELDLTGKFKSVFVG